MSDNITHAADVAWPQETWRVMVRERDARIAALEALARDVAALWGMPIYARDTQGYESTAHVCRLVDRARALLADKAEPKAGEYE